MTETDYNDGHYMFQIYSALPMIYVTLKDSIEIAPDVSCFHYSKRAKAREVIDRALIIPACRLFPLRIVLFFLPNNTETKDVERERERAVLNDSSF